MALGATKMAGGASRTALGAASMALSPIPMACGQANMVLDQPRTDIALLLMARSATRACTSLPTPLASMRAGSPSWDS